MVVHGADHSQMSVLVSFLCMLVELHLVVCHVMWLLRIQVLLHVLQERRLSASQCLWSGPVLCCALLGSPQELAELSYKRCNLPLNIPRHGLLSSSHPETHIKEISLPLRRWCRRLSGGLKSPVTGPTSRGHRPPDLL